MERMSTDMQLRPLLTIRQVAARLSLSESTVRRRIEMGELPALASWLISRFTSCRPSTRATRVAPTSSRRTSGYAPTMRPSGILPLPSARPTSERGEVTVATQKPNVIQKPGPQPKIIGLERVKASIRKLDPGK
jgi:hypothetical protein